MQQLAGVDAAFLHLETPQMPMHVGALHLFELPADYAGNYLDDLRAHIAGRLALLPPLRRRLEAMPLNLANPVWVDAKPDLEKHIVGISLPAGSGLAALEQQFGCRHDGAASIDHVVGEDAEATINVTNNFFCDGNVGCALWSALVNESNVCIEV